MYEVMYDIFGLFVNLDYYKNGKQLLVYSFGDKIGYGVYGDYLFGWEDGVLQRVMDGLGMNCFSEQCFVLKL